MSDMFCLVSLVELPTCGAKTTFSNFSSKLSFGLVLIHKHPFLHLESVLSSKQLLVVFHLQFSSRCVYQKRSIFHFFKNF